MTPSSPTPTSPVDNGGPAIKSSAMLSPCGTYRYRLERVWDSLLPKVAFIMLNPSTADAEQDDPTIRRCIGFAKVWGFGGLIVGNLFALRSTNPKALYSHPDPVGPMNDEHLSIICQTARKIVCAWGTHGSFMDRGNSVAKEFEFFPLVALKVTKDGQPGHPLYVAASAEPFEFFAADALLTARKSGGERV